MKIEVIRKESKPVEVEPIVGGAYTMTTSIKTYYYVLTRDGDGYRWLSPESGVLATSGAETIEAIRGTIARCHMVYVPNARLVIEES
jgi:hypothetical protein